MSLPTSMLRALKTYRDETKTLAHKASAIKADVNIASIFRQIPDNLEEDYSHIQQRKTWCQLILLSCAVCGIEFCYAAETAFVSPTLLRIGIPVAYMTFVWGLSPFIGFMLVPVLGSLSDRCALNLGRRRPFILGMSIGIVMGLLLVPNGKDLGIVFGDSYSNGVETIARNNNDYNRTPTGNALNEQRHNNFQTNDFVANEGIYYTRIPPVTQNETENANWQEAEMETRHNNHNPWGIVFTIIGVVLLDLNCDACQSPCRTYLLDVSTPEDHNRGLSTFTVMAGMGGSMGYLLGGMNWENTHFGEKLGGHVRVVFTMVLFIYTLCLILTVTSVKEVPLMKLGITNEDLQKSKTVDRKNKKKYRKFVNEDSSSYSSEDEVTNINTSHGYGAVDDANTTKTTYESAASGQLNGLDTDKDFIDWGDRKPRDIANDVKSGTVCNGDVIKSSSTPENQQIIPEANLLNLTRNATLPPNDPSNEKKHATKCYEMQQDCHTSPGEITLKTYLMSIVRMPKSLIVLCITNLFCWMSLVCYSLYFTDFVGQAVFKGDPNAPEGSEAHQLYERGVRWGSLGMSLYSASCSAYSMCIGKLVRKIGAKPVYIASQLVYTMGAITMAWSRDRVVVIVLSPTAGVMYATLFTMPYFLVAHYHSTSMFEEEADACRRKQVRGLGTDVATVSSMVFVAQFLLSLFMGGLMHYSGSTCVVMYTAAVLSCCGAVAASQVLYMGM